MPLYDYYCEKCDDVFEALVKIDTRMNQPCPECKSMSHMKMSAPRIALDPISGDFPGATFQWEKRRKQKMAQEVKQDKTHLE